MNIGIFFAAKKRTGGAYQYALIMLNALKLIRGHNYFIFNFSPDFPFEEFKLKNWKIIDLYSKSETKKKTLNWKQLILKILNKLKLYKLRLYLGEIKSKKEAESFYKYNLDLIFYPLITKFSYLIKIPSIVTIHDMGHRLVPQFPEISTKGQYTIREHLYKKCIKAADYVFVDLETGKEDLIKYYKTPENKVIVLSGVVFEEMRKSISLLEAKKILKKYNLPARFIFYPAQFWPHKNHRNLIKALAVLKKRNIIIPLVLTGTKKEEWGEFDKVINLIKRGGLEKQVYYLGYISGKKIAALYKLALAMVMPTLLPTSNYPITEAWYMDCPVLYSDLRGCRDQAGDAALLFKPDNPKDIADKIKMIWENENLRNDLIRKGKKKLSKWTIKDFNKRIAWVIDDFEKKHK